MRAIYVLKHTLLLIWMLSSFASAAADKSFKATWEPVLATLNQDPTSKAAAFNKNITVDLLALNAKELATIEVMWKKNHPTLSGKKTTKLTPEQRDDKNRFFHDDVSALNQEILDTLAKDAMTHRTPPKDYRAIADRIIETVKKNPIATIDAVTQYEHGSDIGFCFGRALYVHHLLLQAGVKQEDLVKIFNVGQLLVQGQMWNFHVAMMVRDSKDGFLVVDPLAGKTLDYKSWIKQNADYEVKRSLSRGRFYLTDPRKFMVGPGAYSLEALSAPHLKAYFTDLGKTL